MNSRRPRYSAVMDCSSEFWPRSLGESTLLSIRRFALIIIIVGLIVAIPLYGVLTGRLADMMGGRMMVWGFTWIAIILVIAIVGVAAGLVRVLKSMGRRT